MFNSTLLTPSSLCTSLPIQQQRQRRQRRFAMSMPVSVFGITMMAFISAKAQMPVPSVTDSNLAVRTVVSGLTQPVTMAFLAPGDFFVTEKASGKLLHVVNGAVVSTVIRLPVNSASERG